MSLPHQHSERPTRVLVVDDSAGIRRMLAVRLRHAGFEVVEAADGHEALRVFRSEPALVVVTDVNMPGLGGLDLMAELRQEPIAPEVILLAGGGADEGHTGLQARRLGADDYITKAPAALDAVVLAVERAETRWRRREKNGSSGGADPNGG